MKAEAAARKVIDRFQGPYGFLSNFFPATAWLDWVAYPTVEHAYQAAKTLDAGEREYVRSADRPGEAKRRGRRVTMRPDWDAVKLGIMLALLRQKFEAPALRRRLLETGDALLVEGNAWGDTFWGVCRGAGANHLGKLLMQVREELAAPSE